mmetsp:Transcript_59708/g.122498  ORF Transcript_59708/g.122498 Transcript_59708/m.122498 type:complete len:109 (+) Transcript_59708:244-570(+)
MQGKPSRGRGSWSGVKRGQRAVKQISKERTKVISYGKFRVGTKVFVKFTVTESDGQSVEKEFLGKVIRKVSKDECEVEFEDGVQTLNLNSMANENLVCNKTMRVSARR